MAYGGGTGVVVPLPLRSLLGLPSYLELGIIYKAYMVLLVIFCCNAINILAGVNGLEAGQTFIIACAVVSATGPLIVAQPLSCMCSLAERSGELLFTGTVV